MQELLQKKLVNQLSTDALDLWPANFEEYEKLFNRACLAIANYVVENLALFPNIGDVEDSASIKQKTQLSSEAEYLLNQILIILEEEGIVIQEGHTYRRLKKVDMQGPAEALVQLTRQFPREAAAFQWVARALDGMIDFIRGKVYPEDILFPAGDLQLVEEIYYQSDVYGFYSKLAGCAVQRVIDINFKTKVKLLEIGAGTGNGTENVLKNNCHDLSQYFFTDISKSILRKSKRKFRQDFFKFKSLDITKDPVEQGFEPNTFDIILAVNVLHATNNVQTALANIFQLLKKEGCLILSEISPPAHGIYRYMELTFGLLPSYYQYQDKDIRPKSPIIRMENWIQILKESRFSEIDVIPDQNSMLNDRGGILLAFK